MKNSIIVIASMAVLTIAGCSKIKEAGVQCQPASEKCELTVNYAGNIPGTRVTGQTSANEASIQNVQIFVFRGGTDQDAGTVDACVSAGFGTPLNYNASSTPYSGLTLTCTVGLREIWAVVNGSADYTADGSVGSKAALLSKITNLNENTPSKLFMIGSASAALNPGKANVDVLVKRVCASVILRSVKNDMEAKIYRAGGSFKIGNVYLVNVPARTDYALTTAPSSLGTSDWYAKMKCETDASKTALISDSRTPAAVEYGTTSNIVHTFYSYPNNCAPSTNESWSARATRLVIEAQYYDGSAWHKCYYPVTLYNAATGKGLERNKQYTVDLTIKRPGSSSPDVPVQFDSVTGSITVAAWDAGDSYTEII